MNSLANVGAIAHDIDSPAVSTLVFVGFGWSFYFAHWAESKDYRFYQHIEFNGQRHSSKARLYFGSCIPKLWENCHKDLFRKRQQNKRGYSKNNQDWSIRFHVTKIWQLRSVMRQVLQWGGWNLVICTMHGYGYGVKNTAIVMIIHPLRKII